MNTIVDFPQASPVTQPFPFPQDMRKVLCDGMNLGKRHAAPTRYVAVAACQRCPMLSSQNTCMQEGPRE